MESLKTTMLLGLCLLMLGVHTDSTPCPPCTISNLSCHNDYSQRITCVWNSTSVTEHSDVCTLQAHRIDTDKSKPFVGYNTSCKLEPTDVSGLRTCSLLFDQSKRFMTYHILSLRLMCVQMTETLSTSYQPRCHIKLDAPGKADINGTTLCWIPQKEQENKELEYELQWRPEERPWSDASVKLLTLREERCWDQLDTDSLTLHHRYSLRLRVRLQAQPEFNHSEWSDWSPTASWESPVGKTKETPGQDGAGLCIVAAVALILILIYFRRMDRRSWVYVMKMIQGQPLPHPTASLLKKKWQSPAFSSESYLSFFKPVDIIASVELSTADHKPKPEESHRYSSFSSFSNPMYPQLSPAATVLEPCSADSPYGPVGEGEQHTQPELDMLQFLTRAQQSDGLPVICDYEKVESVQVERLRLQSLDSGVGSGEEVSQDSVVLHEDSESKTTGNNLHTLFGPFRATMTENLIQVCSEYQEVQVQSLEVRSLVSD